MKSAAKLGHNILFRFDMSVDIGMGHAVRCLALADHLKEFFDCNIYFAMRHNESPLSKHYTVFESDEVAFDYESWLTECIRMSNTSILIMDIRDGLSRQGLKAIKKNTGVKLITIDDPEEKRLEADIGLYPAVPQIGKMDWTDFSGDLYVGWEYVILRKQFCNKIKNKVSDEPVILVSMGGTDKNNMTGFAINVLNELNHKFRVIIILGLKYPHMNELRNDLDRVDFQYELFHNPEDVADVMLQAQFAIVSFGVTAYELAAVNIPALYFCISPDHLESSRLFEQSGIGETIGEYPHIEKERLMKTIEKYICNPRKISAMSKRASQIKISNIEKISSLIMGRNTYA